MGQPKSDGPPEEEAPVEIKYTPVNERVASILLSEMKQIPSIQIADYKFYLELDVDITPEMERVAREELRETPEIVEKSLAELIELLNKEEDLKVPIHNRTWLIRFLRATKYYPESALEMIKRYYSFKVKHSDIYDGLLPSKETKVFEQNILIFQQERDQLGRRVLAIKLGKQWDPSAITLDDFFKGIVLLLELGLMEVSTQIHGVVIILDMNGLSLTQTTKFTPAFVKRLLDWLQDAAPIRVKNIHIVNQPYIFKIIFKIFKMFLRDKLRSRLIFHGTDRKSLHKYIDANCLPEEYGGVLKLPELTQSPWKDLLGQCDQEYEAINSYGFTKKT